MSNRTVADGDGAGFGEGPRRLRYQQGADEHHGAVGQLGARWLQIGSICLHLVGGNHYFVPFNYAKCKRKRYFALIRYLLFWPAHFQK